MATSLRIDDAMKARIQSLAAARSRSAHWIMREAIRDFVEREEKREAFRRAGLDAWEAFQRTGLHLTGDEADTWLAALETSDEPDAPACHA